MVEAFAARTEITQIISLSRSGQSTNHPKVSAAHIDITNEESIANAAATIKQGGEIDYIIIASGILSDGDALQPEKSWRDLDLHSLEQVFRMNTFGPALVGKYFLPLLPRKRRAIFAALSARVGSISDNQIGGWHAYRASKSALNMIIRNFSIELGRRSPDAICVGLHPGTVATNLSAKFSSGVKHNIFTPKQSAEHLLSVLDRLTPADTGKVFDWKGELIPS